MHGIHCHSWKSAHHVGLFLVFAFVVCFAWYFINPASNELHLALLRLSILGFNQANTSGFILGVIQSYIWGYIIAGIWFLAGCCTKPCTSKTCCKK